VNHAVLAVVHPEQVEVDIWRSMNLRCVVECAPSSTNVEFCASESASTMALARY